MRKVNAFKGVLLGVTGVVAVSGVPVSAISERHPGIPLTMEGRPKVMVESIDLLHNSMTFEYVDDGEMPVEPGKVEVAWFNEERYVSDTSEVESMVNLWRTTELVLAERVSNSERTDIGGGVVRYTFENLSRDLGVYDPTGKLTFLVKFELGETEVFWNGQVDYTQCLIEYRDEVNDMSKTLSKGICRGSYDGGGTVRYNLEVGYGEPEPEEPVEPGPEEPVEPVEPVEPEPESPGEPSEPSEPGETGESGKVSDWSGGGDVNWDDVAQSLGVTLTSYTGNEIEILRRERGAIEGAEVANVAEGNGDVGDSNGEVDGSADGGDDTQEEGAEVPELNGEDENSGKVKWWMIVVMGGLALGVGAWWIVPILKRRKDDKEE